MTPMLAERLQTVVDNLRGATAWRPRDVMNFATMLLSMPRATGRALPPLHAAQVALTMFTRMALSYEPRMEADAGAEEGMEARALGHTIEPTVALFVDAPAHLSGVSLTLQSWAEEAKRAGRPFFLHMAGSGVRMPGAKCFPSVGTLRLSSYPGLDVPIPDVRAVTEYMRGHPFDVAHLSTPGPMGLLGMRLARERGAAVCGTYHTDFPRYVRELTGSAELEVFTWQFMVWFYGQMDRVAAPSRATRDDLVAHGLEAEKVRVVGRGVELGTFSPRWRVSCCRRRSACARGGGARGSMHWISRLKPRSTPFGACTAMLHIDPAKTRYRTLWISDVHLGMKASRAACLADFLERHDADTLYLVGDIIDGLRLRRKWNWTADCDRVVRLLLDKARAGTRMIGIPGNHDAFLRAYAGETICGIRIEPDFDHVTADGRLLHIQHGDAFDSHVRLARLEAWVGHGVYHVATLVNVFVFALRRRMGLGYWSLARFLKSKSRKAATYVRSYEDHMIAEARKRKARGVISGHIHQPAVFERDGIQYDNTGDWVDHCTLLAEHRDGSIELITWDERAMAAGAVGDRAVPQSSGYAADSQTA